MNDITACNAPTPSVTRGPGVARREFLAGAGALAMAALHPAVLRGAEGGKPRYRAAIIGHTGRGDYGHGLDKVWQDVPQAEVLAVADPDPQGAAKTAKLYPSAKPYADYRRMLDEVKPDLLSIGARWIDQHRDMIVAAAERGVKGIYLEKPLCRTLEEADAMIAACQKANTKVALAFQTRYSPKLAFIRELIQTDKLGQILEFRARGKEDSRGGAEDLWVLGPHLMDLIVHFGGEAKWCFANVCQQGQPIRKEHVKPGAEGISLLAGDEVHAMYRLAGGATAYFDSLRNAGGGPRFGLWIFGSKGVVEMGTNYLPFVAFLPHASWSQPRAKKEWIAVSSAGLGKPEPLKAGPHEGNVAAVQDLIEAVEKNRQPAANLASARSGLEMIVSVFESQRLGTPVPLPLTNRKDPLAAL